MLKQANIQKYLFLLINLVVRGCVGRFCLVGGEVRFDSVMAGHPPF